MNSIIKRLVLAALTAFLVFSTVAMAGRHYDRRYVRISHLEGNVVFRNEADTDWVAGSVNTPLQESDRIYVPLNSRVEIEFDDGSYLRLAEDSEMRILNLDEKLIRVEMPIGLATLRFSGRVLFELRTPAGMARFDDDGLYRVEVMKDGGMDLAVHKGKAQILRASERMQVKRNQAVYLPADTVRQATYREVDREDAWDSWNDRRDAIVLASNSRQYLSPDVYIGVTPLDHFGTWVHLGGEYGYGWSPVGISFGWSPYRHGRWVHRPYWGWTWVSYEPWGWLPYHYGRWHYHPVHRWCWLPGQSMSFRFWSPGVVHFYHHNNRVHWLPLGPRDHYDHNNYYYNVHNINYNTYIQNFNSRQALARRDIPSENIHVQGALVSVDRDNMTNGRPFEFRQVPAKELANWKATPVSSLRDIDIRPTASSLSPNPQITAQQLNLADLRRDASLSQQVENKTELRPTVRQLDTRSASAMRDGAEGNSTRRTADGTANAFTGGDTRSTAFREPVLNSSGRREIADSNSRMVYESPRQIQAGSSRDADSGFSPRTQNESLTHVPRSTAGSQSDSNSTRRRFVGNYEQQPSVTSSRDSSPREGVSASDSTDSRIYEPRRRSVAEPSTETTAPSSNRRDTGDFSNRTTIERDPGSNTGSSRRVIASPEQPSGGSSVRRDLSGGEQSQPSVTPRSFSQPSNSGSSRRTFDVAPSGSSGSSSRGDSPSVNRSRDMQSPSSDRGFSSSPRSSSPSVFSAPSSSRRDVWVGPQPSTSSRGSSAGQGQKSAPSRRPEKQ